MVNGLLHRRFFHSMAQHSASPKAAGRYLPYTASPKASPRGAAGVGAVQPPTAREAEEALGASVLPKTRDVGVQVGGMVELANVCFYFHGVEAGGDQQEVAPPPAAEAEVALQDSGLPIPPHQGEAERQVRQQLHPGWAEAQATSSFNFGLPYPLLEGFQERRRGLWDPEEGPTIAYDPALTNE